MYELEPDEYAEYSVVGVSFYAANFEKVKRLLRASSDSSEEIQVTLRHNPDNPKSPSRTAVGVYYQGLHLGHIPESSSGLFVSRVLSRTGGSVACGARIWFGGDLNSLRLRISWPIRLKGEEGEVDLSYVDGDGRYSLKMKTSGRKIPWTFISKTRNRVIKRDVLGIGEVVLGDDGLISSGEYGREPYFQSNWGDIASFYAKDITQVQRVLNSVGGQALVRYRLTRTSETAHTLELDWNLPQLAQSTRNLGKGSTSNSRNKPRSLTDGSLPPLRWPKELEPEQNPNRAKLWLDKENKNSPRDISVEDVLKGLGKVLLGVSKVALVMVVIAGKLLALNSSSTKKRRKKRYW